MIEKYFSELFFSKNFNKSWRRGLNWINLKLKNIEINKSKIIELKWCAALIKKLGAYRSMNLSITTRLYNFLKPSHKFINLWDGLRS